MSVGDRIALLQEWLKTVLPAPITGIAPASSDASFRRYFRVGCNGETYVVMDAPPDKEDCGPFIAVGKALHALGLQVPEVLASDLSQGFLLLTDLGSRPYLPALNTDTVASLYGDALAALARLQTGGDPTSTLLPPYDTILLHREMALFSDWFLNRLFGLALTDGEQQVLEQVFARLAESALAQPRVWVHRDYHSRNLMVTDARNPGILDFQDAVIGPVTYDLVSLLRDCYIAWPYELVEGWVEGYRTRLQAVGIQGIEDAAQFLQWFDWMGVQRHLKAIGIFSRLHLRDGKPGYLPDIPRTLGYVLDVAHRYPALAPLDQLLRSHGLADWTPRP